MHHSNHGVGRRRVLQLGATGLAVSAAGVSARQPEPPATKPAEGTAKNVIFLVADGMSAGTFSLGEMLRDVMGVGPSNWSRVWQRRGVRRATCSTSAANGWVTDSAAAGSAWGIGVKVNNGAINLTPDGRMPEPILATARTMGKATGLVTTTRITHATPASFIANVPKRSMEEEIAEQMLDRGVDLLLGGGAKHFSDSLLARYSNVHLITDRDGLFASRNRPGRLLGLFNDDHVGYALDRTAAEPSLAEMARIALDRLTPHTDGFVLQIEGGRIDHAAHNNDAAAMIHDQLDFDEAIGVVSAWADGRDDTLVIITTDHGNANPGLTYYGERGVESFEKLCEATRSFEWIMERSRTLDRGFDGLLEAIHEATTVTLTDAETAVLRRAVVDREPVNAFDLANGTMPVLGSLLANHFGVAFVSPNHTADHVEVTAYGPGSGRMPSLIDNTALYHMAMAAMSPVHASPWASSG